MLISQKKVEFTLILLSVYLSLSFVPDVGNNFVKFILYSIFYLFLIICVLFHKTSRSINLDAIGIIIFILTILIFMGRLDEFKFVIKIVTALIMVSHISVEKMIDIIHYCSRKLFYPTVLAFIFASLGITYNVSGILTNGEELYITPLLTTQKSPQVLRASSYFWEPGVFSFVVNLLIIYRLFVNKVNLMHLKTEYFYIIISQSLGGIIALILILLINIVSNKVAKRFIDGLFLLISAFVILFIYDLKDNIDIITYVLNEISTFFLNRDLYQDASFSARIIDAYVPFYAALDKPLFGHASLENFVTHSEYVRGFSADRITNSWANMSYNYGFVFCFLYLYIIYKGVIKTLKNKLLYFVLIFMLACSPVYVNTVVLFVLFGFYIGEDMFISTTRQYIDR